MSNQIIVVLRIFGEDVDFLKISFCNDIIIKINMKEFTLVDSKGINSFYSQISV